MPEVQPWSRRQALTTVTVAGLAVVAVLVGAVLSLYLTFRPGAAPEASVAEGVPQAGAVVDGREEIAAAPMLEITPADATGGTPATSLPEQIKIPRPTDSGPARIPTGFPHTPEGAVGQLNAIVGDVVTTMSIPHAHEVYQAWSVPGAAPAHQWSMTQNVARFLESAGIPGQSADGRVQLRATPQAGQVKGSDGPDWVVACVLLTLEATYERSAEVAYGHCERMTWQTDRWVIDQGPAPAAAPSTWAGTDLAVQAGWRTWSWAD